MTNYDMLGSRANSKKDGPAEAIAVCAGAVDVREVVGANDVRAIFRVDIGEEGVKLFLARDGTIDVVNHGSKGGATYAQVATGIQRDRIAILDECAGSVSAVLELKGSAAVRKFVGGGSDAKGQQREDDFQHALE
jgi:hypothetical protein